MIRDQTAGTTGQVGLTVPQARNTKDAGAQWPQWGAQEGPIWEHLSPPDSRLTQSQCGEVSQAVQSVVPHTKHTATRTAALILFLLRFSSQMYVLCGVIRHLGAVNEMCHSSVCAL